MLRSLVQSSAALAFLSLSRYFLFPLFICLFMGDANRGTQLQEKWIDANTKDFRMHSPRISPHHGNAGVQWPRCTSQGIRLSPSYAFCTSSERHEHAGFADELRRR